MAIIVLEPGEEFEHYHTDTSRTELLSGNVTLEIESQSHPLQPGKTVTIPRNTAHTLSNKGSGEARVACYH